MEGSCQQNYQFDTEHLEGLDERSVDGDDETSLENESVDGTQVEDEDINADRFSEEDIHIEGVQDFADIDWESLVAEQVMRLSFPDLEVAHTFYSWYARVKGFAVRKSRYVYNRHGEIVQQTFYCNKEGFRQGKYVNNPNPVRRSKPVTRCGCEAQLRVHFDFQSGRWVVTYFHDSHNHEMTIPKLNGMAAAHRKMSRDDIMQMNNMRKVGISMPSIYKSFASQSGGFQNVTFNMMNMYNQVEKQRNSDKPDVKSSLGYMRKLAKKDPALFCCHTVDEEGRFQHMFWADGISRKDYEIFGDVLAFDSTYGKNKYYCPLVVFSGVNHHNQSTIFAFGLIANEKEETYVWLLEQFLLAMNGKTPISVITDSDKSMKNAIKRVFPNAAHRLCAWHLTKNATSNIHKKRFTAAFEKLMLGDYEIGEFKRGWDRLVERYGVQNHRWILEMYEKRHMWCSAYLRGKFFAGFRTTSRCEALHSQLIKFVDSRNNLHEFLQHLHRCLDYMRYREVEADFVSHHGQPVPETMFPTLERSAAAIFTREVYYKFVDEIKWACSLEVVGCKHTQTFLIFILSKHHGNGNVKCWHVSYYPQQGQFRCSCEMMESMGIPCQHIVATMVHLDIQELPESLILPRWTKCVRDSVEGNEGSDEDKWDTMLMIRYASLLDFCKKLCALGCRSKELFDDTRHHICSEIEHLEERLRGLHNVHDDGAEEGDDFVSDPVRARTKGSAPVASSSSAPKRVIRCGLCREIGHNRQTCKLQQQIDGMAQNVYGTSAPADIHEDDSMYEP